MNHKVMAEISTHNGQTTFSILRNGGQLHWQTYFVKTHGRAKRVEQAISKRNARVISVGLSHSVTKISL